MRLIIGKNGLLTALLLGHLLIVLGEPYRYTSLMSAGTTMIFLCIAVLFLMRLFEYNVSIGTSDILLFLLIIASMFSFLYAGTYNYAGFVPLMCFLETPILISSFDYKDEKVERKIYILFYIISLWYIFLNLTDVAYLYRGPYGEEILDILTLGFRNPNQTAMNLCFTFFVLITAIYRTVKKSFKCLCAINSAVMFFMILKTQSRAAIVLVTIFVFVLLVKKQAMVGRWFKNKAMLIPILFAVFLLLFGDLYQNATFLNEEFDTGRASIFKNALDSMKNVGNIIFGNYYEYAQQNLHNSMVSVLVEYGIIVAIIFVAFYQMKVRELHRYTTKNNEVAFLSLVTVFAYSSVEATFFVAGSFYAVSFLTLYYLCLPIKKTNAGSAADESITD